MEVLRTEFLPWTEAVRPREGWPTSWSCHPATSVLNSPNPSRVFPIQWDADDHGLVTPSWVLHETMNMSVKGSPDT